MFGYFDAESITNYEICFVTLKERMIDKIDFQKEFSTQFFMTFWQSLIEKLGQN